MLTFSEAQVSAWLLPLFWPFLRALALLSVLPVLGNRSVPARVRIALAGFIAFAAQPSLPALGAEVAATSLDSPMAFMLVAQQLVIGLSLGFAVRLVFAAVEFGGELIGQQMGLNFAGFFDPVAASNGTATARFFGTLVAWMFVVIGGHLIVIAALVQSFQSFPIGPEPFAFVRQTLPHQWGAEIFAVGFWIALPIVTMILMVNLILGAVSRVAPQVNIFALGFPVTLSVGLLGLLLTLPALEAPFTMALERVLENFR